MNKNKILLTITDNIANKNYETIGLVTGNKLIWASSKKLSFNAILKLEEEAINLGAAAVVGIKPDTTSTGSQCYIDRNSCKIYLNRIL